MGISQFQASGGISALQSRARAPRREIPSGPQKDSFESKQTEYVILLHPREAPKECGVVVPPELPALQSETLSPTATTVEQAFNNFNNFKNCHNFNNFHNLFFV